MTIYGARHIKHDRWTAERVNTLDEQIIAVLAEDYPQSVRQVFYWMTISRLAKPVEKSDRGYRHFQERCVKPRQSGPPPYGWLANSTRRGFPTHTFSGAPGLLRRTNGLHRPNLWIGKSLERKLRANLERSIDLSFQGSGITERQITKFALPSNPRKVGDKRSQRVKFAVKAEATPAVTMRAMVPAIVERYLRAHALKVDKVTETEERKSIDRLARMMESAGG